MDSFCFLIMRCLNVSDFLKIVFGLRERIDPLRIPFAMMTPPNPVRVRPIISEISFGVIWLPLR